MTFQFTTVHARRELANDGSNRKFDVIIYEDEALTKRIAKFPWHYTGNPTKNSKKVILNCNTYQLKWHEKLNQH